MIMKRSVLATLLICFLFSGTIPAQFNYNLTVSKEAYQPLVNGTSLNDTVIWDDEFYKLPLGFTMNFDGKSTEVIQIESMMAFATDTAGWVHAFMATDLDLYDRGNAGDSVTRSPVRYELTGAPGHRIMKLEIANAGIYDEYDLYQTNNDSVNFQLWLHEGTDIVELRYGPSNISHYSDYYFITGLPMMGFIKNIMLGTQNFDAFYYFTGNPTAPAIDSAKTGTGFTAGLDIHPPDSTVYRFTPVPVGIGSVISMLGEVQLLSNTGNSFVALNNPHNSSFDYKILSVNGTVSQSGTINTGMNKIDISGITVGIHILVVSDKEGIRAFRINKI